jgi:hypothetical protein
VGGGDDDGGDGDDDDDDDDDDDKEESEDSDQYKALGKKAVQEMKAFNNPPRDGRRLYRGRLHPTRWVMMMMMVVVMMMMMMIRRRVRIVIMYGSGRAGQEGGAGDEGLQ